MYMQIYFYFFSSIVFLNSKLHGFTHIRYQCVLRSCFPLDNLSVLVSEFWLLDFTPDTKIITLLCIIMLLYVIISHSVVGYHHVIIHLTQWWKRTIKQNRWTRTNYNRIDLKDVAKNYIVSYEAVSVQIQIDLNIAKSWRVDSMHPPRSFLSEKE